MFDTYGPFILRTHDSEGLDDLFRQFREENPDLQYGIGIYVVGGASTSGKLIPWYVGRTETEFGKRIKRHYTTKKFSALLDRIGPLTFFIIPRATPGGKVKAATDHIKQDGLKSIRQLEFALIGSCLKLNPELLNKQEKTFHTSMHVPGYIDNGSSERNFPAAKALSKLLKT